MALVKLGNKASGYIVKIKEYGIPVDHVVVQQGRPSSMYDVSCDGTWLLRKDIAEKCKWNSRYSVLDTSSSHVAYLNGAWLDRYDTDIKDSIKFVKIPYLANESSQAALTGADGLPCRVFLLSRPETNTAANIKAERLTGSVLEYFSTCTTNAGIEEPRRIAYFDGNPDEWWLRDQQNNERAMSIIANGRPCAMAHYVSNELGLRPCLILPANLWVSDDGTVVTNTAPTTPPSLNVPSQINGGSTITIAWGTATDSEDNLEGYKAERSTDGGSTWTQIYQGSSNSTTNTVPFGTQSVMYRVKAYDSEGLESGWKTSAQVTVINNTAPTVPGSITVPEQVQGGQPLAIAWSASTDGENNLAGYSLERQVDGGEWAVIYSGGELGFTDQITKGWLSVAYRVRAYDAANAYSGFAVSQTREVNNNTPPVISCEQSSGSSLGTKNEGFEIPYSVADEEGDEVTVTEAVDGTALRTFTVELGAANSLQLGGLDFMKLLNGRHTLSVSASDGASSAVHSLSFTKEVTAASVTLEQPMTADGPITVCVLSASGFIPGDADFQVLVTNNALDDSPVWEDCTAAVKAGANYIFDNSAAANGFAFNFRLSVERGPSGLGGHITSVQGGFQ